MILHYYNVLQHFGYELLHLFLNVEGAVYYINRTLALGSDTYIVLIEYWTVY